MAKVKCNFEFQNITTHMCVVLVMMNFFLEVETVYSCDKDQDILKFCEAPCVVQVGLTVVRVTFNKFFVQKKCVQRAAIAYWIANETSTQPNEMVLDNYEKIYPKDCTYHRNDPQNLLLQTQYNVSEVISRVKNYIYQEQGQNDNRYIYLDGLRIGGTYSIEAHLNLKHRIDGRSLFSSIPTNITLSTDEPFKSHGLVGHVNQGRCCDIKNNSYIIDRPSGKCKMKTSTPNTGFNFTFYIIAFSAAVFLLSAIFMLLCAMHRSHFQVRRYNSTVQYHVPEGVSFKYVDPEELYLDLSSSHETCHLRQKLLKNPTVAIRLSPDGEELDFEELKPKLKRQSI